MILRKSILWKAPARFFVFILLLLFGMPLLRAQTAELKFQPADSASVSLRGLAGRALGASRNGRLKTFIRDPESQPIRLFAPSSRSLNQKGDWNGEHAGKWLVATARAAHRSGDNTLRESVIKVADYLVSVQEKDGYLGTYATEARFTSDAAYQKLRTWDLWIHSYMILGLLEANRLAPHASYVESARRIGDLCWTVLSKGDKNVAWLGNHLGLSATILLDPAVELFLVTGEQRYLELARLVMQQADVRQDLQLFARLQKGVDLQEIGDGKIYQLLWNCVGLAKFQRTTGESTVLDALRRAWKNTTASHLTAGGGPWGGVGVFTEVFNLPGYFNPEGFVEVCSLMSWIQLNRELLMITGEARFAEEIEKTLYNDLLGAQHPDGENWCYFVHPNGQRKNTYYWACCKSSGALALEEIPPLVAGRRGEGIAVNIYSSATVVIPMEKAGRVTLEQDTRYPFDGRIELRITPERSAAFPLALRIPSWASNTDVQLNDQRAEGPKVTGEYFTLSRTWSRGDSVRIDLPMKTRLLTRSNVVVQDGSREIARSDYFAMARGPLVYATGLLDGFKREETLKLPPDAEERFREASPPPGMEGPAFALQLGYREPILYLPYFEADGRKEGGWRLTWHSFLREP